MGKKLKKKITAPTEKVLIIGPFKNCDQLLKTMKGIKEEWQFNNKSLPFIEFWPEMPDDTNIYQPLKLVLICVEKSYFKEDIKKKIRAFSKSFNKSVKIRIVD